MAFAANAAKWVRAFQGILFPKENRHMRGSIRNKILFCAMLGMLLAGASAMADDDHDVFDSDKWLPPPPHVVKSVVVKTATCDIDVEYPEFSLPEIDALIQAGCDILKVRQFCEQNDAIGTDEDGRVCEEVTHSRFQVYRVSSRLLTVFREGMSMGGCGPPYHVYGASTFDLESGAMLAAEDFFAIVPAAEDLRIPYYVDLFPTPEGMVFITSGGMVPFLTLVDFDGLEPYGIKKELWQRNTQ